MTDAEIAETHRALVHAHTGPTPPAGCRLWHPIRGAEPKLVVVLRVYGSLCSLWAEGKVHLTPKANLWWT